MPADSTKRSWRDNYIREISDVVRKVHGWIIGVVD